MSAPASSDALVFFGATGDLAHKKVFPALQAMVKRGHLDVPIIGVAKAGWNLDQLKARARHSLETHGGVDGAAFDKLSSLLRYVDGDYEDPATFDLLRHDAGLGAAAAALSRHSHESVCDRRRAAGSLRLRERRTRRGGEAVRSRPRVGTGAQPFAPGRLPRGGRIPHRSLPRQGGRCRTCSISASATRCSSRSGTATTSTACRSPWPRALESRGEEASTTRRAPSGTSSRTTCCK